MNVTRRKVLQGLMAAPVAAAGSALLGCSKKSSAPATETKTVETAKQYLNVVLHGLSMVVIPDKKVTPTAQGIEIWIPTSTKGYDHKYQWGPWCQEGDLPGSVTAVTGIDSDGIAGTMLGQGGSPADLDTRYDAVLKGCPWSSSATNAAQCIIQLPYPAQIFQLRRVCKGTKTSEFMGGDYEAPYPAAPPTNISMVHVFRYRITDPNNVKYGDNKLDVGNYKSFHIWAEPAMGYHAMRNSTIPTPVESMVKGFTGLNIKQSKDYSDRSGELDPSDKVPDGMQPYEEYNLGERQCPTSPAVPKRDCSYDAPHILAKIVHCMALFAYNPQGFTPSESRAMKRIS